MAAPTSPLITSFAGADENPLSEGGAWDGTIFAGGVNFQIVSHQAKAVGTGTGLNARKLYGTTYNADQEVWCTVPGLPNVAADSVALWCRVTGEGVNSTARGMMGTYILGTGWRIYTMVPTVSFNPITSADTTVLVAGDKMWFNCTGTTYSLYHFTGGVWNLRAQVTDSTITGGGKIGAEMDDDATIIDDFGGGNNGSLVSGGPIYPVWPRVRFSG